jgi:hypothetical protein
VGKRDLDDVRRQFADVGAPEPLFVEADVSRSADTKRLLDPTAIVFPGEAEEGAAERQLFNWTTESHVLSLPSIPAPIDQRSSSGP